ncbi:MAG: class I SAM-dependent methyltransferase [Gemmatimonadaceae bacterium]
MIDRPLVFADPLAVLIVGRDAVRELETNPARFGGPTGTSLRGFLAVRSRVAEDALAAAVARGGRQYVVVAAGLDTFAYRNPYSDLRVFEVDHPATQAWKRERLRDVGIAEPPSATYVAADLSKRDLGESLRAAGFDDHAPAFFGWLGTVPYLEPETVDAALRSMAALSSRGGGVVFDYTAPPIGLTPERQASWDAFTERVRAIGEPIRSALDPAGLTADLLGMGFTGAQDMDGPALTARYFAGRTDGLSVSGLGHVMLATR